MSLIVGASQYLNASTLANKKGFTPSVTNVLASRGTVDMLDVARRVSNNGIGLSAAARQLNQQFLSSSAANFNAIFGLSVSENSTIQAMIQKINALRTSLPQSQIREDLRGVVLDPEGNVVGDISDNGAVAPRSTGTVVDEDA